MSVWHDLVGQERVVDLLTAATAAAGRLLRGGDGTGMTHAWLFTGPPGSGRSTAARAFAAALQCPDGGCGHCAACHTALEGTHADVEVVSPVGANYVVAPMRDLVRQAAMAPSGGRWQVVILEDVDRMRGPDLRWQPANVLLKALEEPVAADRVAALRAVGLRRGRAADDPVPLPARLAAHAADRRGRRHAGPPRRHRPGDGGVRRAGGAGAHRPGAAGWRPTSRPGCAARRCCGCRRRCRGCATASTPPPTWSTPPRRTPRAPRRRSTPASPRSSDARSERAPPGGACPSARPGSSRSWSGSRSAGPPAASATAWTARSSTSASFYRDVLAVQLRSGVDAGQRGGARRPCSRWPPARTPEQTLRRIDAVLACRDAIDANAAPLLAVEAMAVALR